MSMVLHCDYKDCETVGYGGGTRVIIDDEQYDFCKPEHAVLWLFATYPEMPLWYGPKREMETASAKA